MSEQMTINDVRKIVHAELEAAGIQVPIELKFDYSFITNTDFVEKTKKFIKICNGDLRNCIYVSKVGTRYDDLHYFDLLFVVDESGDPICLPIPLARRLFNVGSIQSYQVKGVIQGEVYEHIYRHYYNYRNSAIGMGSF